VTEVYDIALAEAPYGSDLYAQALKLREAMLRTPLGLTLSQEELADDVQRRHFCALTNGTVVGSVSFKPLGPHTLQLKQMAVAEARQREGVGSRLLAFAEAWARRGGYGMIILISAWRRSTRGMATWPKASPSTRTPSRISG
jgi:predicted N-acetyltransferase YhbS